MHAVMQLLEGLSEDQIISVLRFAHGSFEQQFLELSASLRSLDALAHLPGLAAVCAPDSEGSETCPDGPILILCVDTHEAQEDLGLVHDETASGYSHTSLPEECAGARMWVQVAEMNSEISGLACSPWSTMRTQSHAACALGHTQFETRLLSCVTVSF